MTAVYFIEAIDTGHFKIGCSVSPIDRFNDLCRQNPQDMRLVASIPVKCVSQRREMQLVERRFHERYLPHHHRGEWFHACPLIRADVAAINAGIFDLETLPVHLSQASLLRVVHFGPRVAKAQAA